MHRSELRSRSFPPRRPGLQTSAAAVGLAVLAPRPPENTARHFGGALQLDVRGTKGRALREKSKVLSALVLLASFQSCAAVRNAVSAALLSDRHLQALLTKSGDDDVDFLPMCLLLFLPHA